MRLFFNIIGVLTWVLALIVGVDAVISRLRKKDYTECDLEEEEKGE